MGASSITLVVGLPRSGKTTWLLAELEKTLGPQRPGRAVVVCHDPHAEFTGRGYFCLTPDDFLRLRLDDIPEGSTVVVDEAPISLPPSTPPKNFVRRVLNQSGHKNLTVYLVCQRPADIHPAARTFATRIVAFNPGTGSEDLAWYQRKLGISEAKLLALPRYSPYIWPEKG